MAGNRPYTQRETRLLSEWLALTYPNERVILQVRLGSPIPSPSGIPAAGRIGQMLANYRRYADFLIIRKSDMILGEAKILADPGVVSTLELYAALLPSTPELAQFKSLRLRKLLLWAVNDPVLATIAKRQGIEIAVYTPRWVLDDLNAKYEGRLRKTTPSWTPPEAVQS